MTTTSRAPTLDEITYSQSPFKIDYTMKNLVRMNLNENLVLPQSFLRSVSVKCLDKLDLRNYPSSLNEGDMLSLVQEISRVLQLLLRDDLSWGGRRPADRLAHANEAQEILRYAGYSRSNVPPLFYDGEKTRSTGREYSSYAIQFSR